MSLLSLYLHNIIMKLGYDTNNSFKLGTDADSRHDVFYKDARGFE